MSEAPTRPAPFSLRLTLEERARLDRDAGSMALGAYIRSRLLDSGVLAPRPRVRMPVKDQQALSRVLGLLGQSRIANNLNQLTKAVHTGSLSLDDGLEADLREAVAHVASIRAMLIDALGLSEGPP